MLEISTLGSNVRCERIRKKCCRKLKYTRLWSNSITGKISERSKTKENRLEFFNTKKKRDLIWALLMAYWLKSTMDTANIGWLMIIGAIIEQ